ncbi:MAG: outer membrane protein OmpA-like peptidoglycan-associated protein [Myxococcota bacterium]
MRSALAALIGLCLLLPASALAGPELLGLQVRDKVQIGGQLPGLIINPQIGIKSLSVRLVPAGGGKTISLRGGKIGRGRAKTLTWKQPVGEQSYQAQFKVRWSTGEAEEFEITLSTHVFPKIASSISKSDVNLEDRTLTVRLNQPAARVALTVWGDTGKVIHQETTELVDVPANEAIEVTWDQNDGVAVLKLQAKVWSAFGFWVGTEISPFEVEIPHEDVVFGFGVATIDPAEEPKLVGALEQVKQKVRLYGKIVELQLYVAGFTDSVGSAASNQGLSQKRARSIASWFKRRGVPVKLFYQGFGETNQAVKTPNETKEARNRRAVYTLSAGRPALISSGWHRL